MNQPDCIFCKIIKGEIPSAKVYEDDKVFAFLDINPVNYGHTLVVPKDHFETFAQTPDEVFAYLLPVAKKIGNALLKLPNVSGFNVIINNGKDAGQAVFHLHIHLAPRIAGDGYEFWQGKKYESSEEMARIAGEIASNI